jgi:hypothetical protein
MTTTEQLNDVVIGTGAVSSVLWWEYVTAGAEAYILIGGVILISLRVWKAWKDNRRVKSD